MRLSSIAHVHGNGVINPYRFVLCCHFAEITGENDGYLNAIAAYGLTISSNTPFRCRRTPFPHGGSGQYYTSKFINLALRANRHANVAFACTMRQQL